jgi:hypothetical protein
MIPLSSFALNYIVQYSKNEYIGLAGYGSSIGGSAVHVQAGVYTMGPLRDFPEDQSDWEDRELENVHD